MQANLRALNKIDLVTHDPVCEEFKLIIVATDEWDDSEEEQDLLLEKINAYLRFALEGELAERLPESKGRSFSIHIDSRSQLPVNIQRLASQLQLTLADQHINFYANVI